MAKLKMTTTLGDGDAERLGLAGAKEGDEIEASGKVADELIKRGWAVEHEHELAEGQADAGEGTAADLDRMTKAELAEYAESLGVEGVTTAMHKDEMIEAILDATGNK